MRQKKPVRQSVWISLVLMLALFLLPIFVVSPFRDELFGGEADPDETLEEALPPGESDRSVMLRVLVGDEVQEMDLGTYLTGVVRAEMPASFPREALRAQAVAARTYTLHKIAGGGKHENAHICTDSTCCQAWTSEEAARENWGRQADRYERSVENAVAATDGEVLLYDGAPILAVFHASSAGMTRAAGDVWQNDVPYLQSVESPESGDTIPNYYSRKSFTAEEFRRKTASVQPDLSGKMSTWLRNAVTDEAGSVETVEIGGVSVKGTKVRELLGLRSACFTWEQQGDELVFFVTGHGHGVGMSQYGASHMAERGADHREILTHYYVGAQVGQLSQVWDQIAGKP